MKNPEFNLLDEPWIPVRLLDGTIADVGCWSYSGARQTLRTLRVSYRRRALRSNVWYWPLRIVWPLRATRVTGLGSGRTVHQQSR